MITIKTASLRAAVLVAPAKETRPYLIGVNIFVRDEGRVSVRATRGSAAFEDIGPDLSMAAGTNFIIPLESAKTLAKSKQRAINFTLRGDGSWEAENLIFKPLDGHFPDCDRIFPTKGADEPGSVYDFDLLALGLKTLRTARESKFGHYRLTTIKGCGLMAPEDADYPRFAVMPLRPAHAFTSQ